MRDHLVGTLGVPEPWPEVRGPPLNSPDPRLSPPTRPARSFPRAARRDYGGRERDSVLAAVPHPLAQTAPAHRRQGDHAPADRRPARGRRAPGPHLGRHQRRAGRGGPPATAGGPRRQRPRRTLRPQHGPLRRAGGGSRREGRPRGGDAHPAGRPRHRPAGGLPGRRGDRREGGRRRPRPVRAVRRAADVPVRGVRLHPPRRPPARVRVRPRLRRRRVQGKARRGHGANLPRLRRVLLELRHLHLAGRRDPRRPRRVRAEHPRTAGVDRRNRRHGRL